MNFPKHIVLSCTGGAFAPPAFCRAIENPVAVYRSIETVEDDAHIHLYKSI